MQLGVCIWDILTYLISLTQHPVKHNVKYTCAVEYADAEKYTCTSQNISLWRVWRHRKALCVHKGIRKKVDYTSSSRRFLWQSSLLRIRWRACASDISITGYVHICTDRHTSTSPWLCSIHTPEYIQSTHIQKPTPVHTHAHTDALTQTHTSFSYNKISPTYPPARAPPHLLHVYAYVHICLLNGIYPQSWPYTHKQTPRVYKHTCTNIHILCIWYRCIRYVYICSACAWKRMCACIHCLASCDRVCKRSSLFLFSDDALSPHTHTYLYIHTRTQVPMLGSPHTIYKYTHYVKIDPLLCKDSLDPPSRLQFHTHTNPSLGSEKNKGGAAPLHREAFTSSTIYI